jgi:hypothetical protein
MHVKNVLLNISYSLGIGAKKNNQRTKSEKKRIEKQQKVILGKTQNWVNLLLALLVTNFMQVV